MLSRPNFWSESLISGCTAFREKSGNLRKASKHKFHFLTKSCDFGPKFRFFFSFFQKIYFFGDRYETSSITPENVKMFCPFLSNLQFSSNFQFASKISIELRRTFATHICKLFAKNIFFAPRFPYFSTISIFDQNSYFGQNFRFLTKSSIF